MNVHNMIPSLLVSASSLYALLLSFPLVLALTHPHPLPILTHPSPSPTSHPHPPLTQVDDDKVSQVCHTLHKCIETGIPTTPKHIKLKRFVSANYMGLFLEDEVARWFRQLMGYFEMEMKQHGESCDLQPIRSSAHVV